MQQKIKILLVGKFSTDESVYTYPSSFEKTFKKLGHLVTTISVNKYDFLPKPLQTLITNYNLLKSCKKIAPSVLFIIKGMDIKPKTIQQIKKENPFIKIAHFYPDNPFCFWNGNSNANVLSCLPFIDIFLIWSKELIPVLAAAGACHARYFPFAVDTDLYHPLPPLEYEKLQSDVVFVGTWDKERAYFLEQLIQQIPSINLAIWGNRWQENLPSSSPLKKYLRSSAQYKNQLLKIFANAKIILNFIRPQNMQAHNMRTFEALATKNFLLTQYTKEQTEAPFKENYNIACFKDANDLVKQVSFYLKQEPLRKEIALRGYTETTQNFTLQRQLEELLDHMFNDMTG